MADFGLNSSLRPPPRPRLTDLFLEAAIDEGRVPGFNNEDPRYGYQMTVAAGQTLMDVARQMTPLINPDGNTVDTARIIAAHNGYTDNIGGDEWRDVQLREGQPLFIPMPEGVEIQRRHMPFIPSEEPTSPGSLGEIFRGAIEATPTDVTEEMILRGEIAPAIAADFERTQDIISALNPTLGPGNTEATILIPAKDDFADIPRLRAPAVEGTGADATLVVTEPLLSPVDNHMQHCYEYALGYGTAIKPDGERPAIFGIREKQFSNADEDIGSIPFRNENEYLVVSHSYVTADTSDIMRWFDADNIGLDTVYFVAAGNGGNVEEQKNLFVAQPEQLGPQSYIVAAAHESNGKKVIADYNSPGADFVAPAIPLMDGEKAMGTSYATPILAAVDRQMLELYGGVLSQEEIMAAALMSTDMDIYKSENSPVHFTTNGGGVPHDMYAGAGMVDIGRWQDTLDLMAGMKKQMEYVPDKIEEQAPLTLAKVEDYGALGQRYTYEVTIPEDMTLDRLSFIMKTEDGTHLRNLGISSPSGFGINVPEATFDGLATQSFALEDVKAGDKLVITSPDPLTADSFAVVRGYGDGSVIQTLRDALMEEDMMPQPNESYIGAQVTADYYRDNPVNLPVFIVAPVQP